MNRNEIKAHLRKLSVEASVAFALRVGLRVLPWLAQNQAQVLMAWKEKNRATHLLAVFSAYDVGLMAVLNRNIDGLRQAAGARRFAADAAAFAAAAAAAADAAAYAATDAAAYAAADATYAAADAAAAAADAAAYAATDAAAYATADGTAYIAAEIAAAASTEAAADAAYATAGIMAEHNSQIKIDLDFVLIHGAKSLLESPLWQGTVPAAWAAALPRFQTAVRELNSGFEPWLDWYEARCRGNAIDEAALKERVFLPKSVLAQTPAQINAYIANLSQATRPLNRVRTIFIGDGEAGKTSLIRVLNKQPVVEGIEAKTPGIAICEWEVPNTPITASFWDFGGQVMVHATHQLFLRETCLYVLLVSAREKEKATERAEYWLEHVKSFGKGAPVLIVANKADKEPVRLDEALLMEKYPAMIKGFFQLSCTEAKGSFRSQFEQFQATFCQQLQAVGLHQVMFQKAHFAVLENLRRRTPQQAFLSHEDYAQLCAENHIAERGGLDRVWLLDILDKLGLIVHFKEMTGMEDYILNPRWLTYGVYTVMYNEQAQITRQQVETLLAAKPVQDHDGTQLSYPRSKCHIIFQAMQRYKLCYFLPRNPDQLIIPALLPTDIKQHGFNTATALEFHYQFESFLPRHLISELIVDYHEDIANINGTDIVWQHGMLLDNKTHRTQALVQADYHFRRLTLWLTTSPAAADFLAVLRHTVEKIVARIDISYTQNIRLPSDARTVQANLRAEAEYGDFEQILALRDEGGTSYTHKSRNRYSIPKILGLFVPTSSTTYEGKTVNNVTNHVTISNSTIHGDVVTAKTIKDSFNTLANSPAAPELKTALDALLQELNRLQATATPEQTPHVRKAADYAQRIVTDTSDAEPDFASCKVSWNGLTGAIKKLTDFGTQAWALAEKVQPLLNLIP